MIAVLQTVEHQNALCRNGAIAALAPLLTSTVYKVILKTISLYITQYILLKIIQQFIVLKIQNEHPYQ